MDCYTGLGLYEYMLLNEDLGTEPVWVINNGISHQESVPSLNGSVLLQNMLDSIQFITGPAESQWGSLRASMGHPEPWNLTYIGIGNEVTHPAYISCVSLQSVIDKGVSPMQWQRAAWMSWTP